MFLDKGVGYAYMFLPTRIDALCFGSLLAVAETKISYKSFLDKILPYISTVAFIMIVAYVFNYGYISRHRLGWPLMYTMVGICFSYWIWKLIENPKEKFMTNAILVQIGKFSYSMYLLHVYVMDLFFDQMFIRDHKIAFFPVYIISLISLSFISWNVIERPFLNLKKYFQ